MHLIRGGRDCALHPVRGIGLKLLRYLGYSEINSEIPQITPSMAPSGQAGSMACREIPCAAEQGNQIAGTGK